MRTSDSSSLAESTENANENSRKKSLIRPPRSLSLPASTLSQKNLPNNKTNAELAQQNHQETEAEKRRRHMEEVREREHEKRQHVEERKRAILAAEQERREKILMKSLERGPKTEFKRRESQTSSFAFGSSTPRLVGATETPPGRRRSASISNGDSTITARRDLIKDQGKKRAISTCVSDIGQQKPMRSGSGSFQMTTTPKRRTSFSMSTSLMTTSNTGSIWSTPKTTTATKNEQKTAPARSSSFSRIPKSISNFACSMTRSAIAVCTSTPKSASKSSKVNSPESNKSLLTSSFMARNKITTEQEAIAALAELRRHKREEAEKQAALLAQQQQEAELKQRLAQEKELQRKCLEESIRLAEEQQRVAEAQRQQAIQAAKIRENFERECAQREILARQEAERRARKETEMLQKLEEAAERLRLEENERKERRKRVEAIMSRMRKVTVDSETDDAKASKEQQQASKHQQLTSDVNSHAKYNVNSTGILIVRESNFNFMRS